MYKKQKEIFLLITLIFILFLINYSYIDSFLINQFEDFKIVNVDRIIDGDTIEFNSTSVRLLGINAPEKGEKYSKKATEFLKDQIYNKTVKLEFGTQKKDRYGRILAYVYLNGENINLKLIKRGLANPYFYQKDKYYYEFQKAWKKCIKNNTNLCKSSEDKCAKCIELNEFNHKSQEVILKNTCNLGCNLTSWNIKDEGRKKFYFPNYILKANQKVSIIVENKTNTKNTLYWKDENYVWTSTGDTLFLRDSNGDLVLYENY